MNGAVAIPVVDNRTTAQRWADTVTEFSGSWAFIGWFTVLCLGWIALNATGYLVWDAYPFLFLRRMSGFWNVLTTVRIQFSQNRQNETDRERMKEILTRLDTLQKTVEALQR